LGQLEDGNADQRKHRRAIQEAFKPGTAPPDSYAAEDATPRAHSVDHDTDRLVGTGTGGLY